MADTLGVKQQRAPEGARSFSMGLVPPPLAPCAVAAAVAFAPLATGIFVPAGAAQLPAPALTPLHLLNSAVLRLGIGDAERSG